MTTAAPWPLDVPPPARPPPGDPPPTRYGYSPADAWQDAPRAMPPVALRRVPSRVEVLAPRDTLPARGEPLEAMLARLHDNPPPATRMLTVYRYAPPEEPRQVAPAGAWMREIERRGR